ncbi:unnamed protein product [Diamesa serratosioi]
MKLFLQLVVCTVLFQYSFAFFGFSKHNKFGRLHREPPFQSSIISFETVEEKWIVQRLNNFDPQDNRTWQMRYFENNNYLKNGGPVLIFVGGEWTASKGSLQTGHMHDMARDLNGTMFYTEHRFYGKSKPTSDVTVANLRFLGMDQALADLANFIVQMKDSIPEIRNSGVILVGGSYSATMVTFFMQKYPHLASGAWSSSAPLNAQKDFIEYMEVVSESIKVHGGDACANRIESAFGEMESLVAAEDTEKITNLFNLCQPLSEASALDRMSFFSDVSGGFAGLVQYHKTGDIEFECGILTNESISDNVAALAAWYLGTNDNCFDYSYRKLVEWLEGTSWTDSDRQWYYQTCSEFGWYQSSGSKKSIFGSSFPVELSAALCNDIYDGIFPAEKILENVQRTNTIYGGFHPAVRNVYSTHGQLDPWRPMGLQEDLNEWSPTTILELESHVSDLNSLRESDTPQMRANKERVFELVQQWLEI